VRATALIHVNAFIVTALMILVSREISALTDGDAIMSKLSVLSIYTFFVLTEPLRAIAQQTQLPTTPQPPQGYYIIGLAPGTCGVTAMCGHIGGWAR
jgi:hypothetical protein